MTPFAKRKIDLTFRLGLGDFGDAGVNELTISGLRVQARIVQAGGSAKGEAQLRIFGMTPSHMNTLSSLNRGYMVRRKNILLITAGDEVSGMSLVFQGQIAIGKIDMSEAPSSSLNVLAFVGMQDASMSIKPISYKGTVDVADILRDLASRMGMAFENTQNVSSKLSTPVYEGTDFEKAEAVVHDAGIEWNHCAGNTLAIWPKGGYRVSVPVVVSPETGMVGYPDYDDSHGGLAIKTLFNPEIAIGRVAKVESSLPFANGHWGIFDIVHALESETPGGQWFTRFNGRPINYVDPYDSYFSPKPKATLPAPIR